MTTVLYVDDQPAMARAVERWFAGRGAGVRVARTIAEAKQHVDTQVYDAIFIDLALHDGSGFELYDWIVEHRPDLAPRVAFVTGDIVQQATRQTRLQHIDRPVLLKPFDLGELDRCVDRWQGAEAR